MMDFGAKMHERRFREEFPAIDINDLARAGLFVSGEAIWEPFPGVGLQVRLVQPWDWEAEVLFPQGAGEPEPLSFTLPLTDVEIGKAGGRKMLFRCPDTGEQRTKLYLRQGRFGSASAHELVNASRNLSRERIHEVKNLVDAELSTQTTRDSQTLTTRESSGIADNQSHAWPLSTEAALARGLESAVSPAMPHEFNGVSRLVGEILAGGPSPSAYNGASALVHSAPCLDSRALANAGLFRDDLFHALIWPPAGQREVRIDLCAVMDTDEPYLFGYGLAGEVRSKFIIRLIGSPEDAPTRWRLQCPVNGQAYDLLYLRGGGFASREAQRLHHPSQDPGVRRRKIARTKGAAAVQLIGRAAESEMALTPSDRLKGVLRSSRVLISLAARRLNVSETALMHRCAAEPDLLDYVDALTDPGEVFHVRELDVETGRKVDPSKLTKARRGGRPQRAIRVVEARTHSSEAWRRADAGPRLSAKEAYGVLQAFERTDGKPLASDPVTFAPS